MIYYLNFNYINIKIKNFNYFLVLLIKIQIYKIFNKKNESNSTKFQNIR